MTALSAKQLSERTGLSPRYFQKLAKHVDWASKPADCRSILFDESGFEEWLAAGKPKTGTKKWRSTGGTGGRTGARSSTGSNTDVPLTRALSEKLRALTQSGSRDLKRARRRKIQVSAKRSTTSPSTI